MWLLPMPSPTDPVFWLITAWVYAVIATAESDHLKKNSSRLSLDRKRRLEHTTNPRQKDHP